MVSLFKEHGRLQTKSHLYPFDINTNTIIYTKMLITKYNVHIGSILRINFNSQNICKYHTFIRKTIYHYDIACNYIENRIIQNINYKRHAL